MHGESWAELDHRTNDCSLNGDGANFTFHISLSSDYRFIPLHKSIRPAVAVIDSSEMLSNFMDI
jgi:hypothetical protein